MIKIAIAEDQALFRRGIIGLINSFEDIEVIEEAENGQILLDKYEEMLEYQEQLPDITILDLNMPVLDGIKTTERLKQLYPNLKIIIISSFDDKDIIVHLYEKGANAYLDKNAEPEEVEMAIRSVFEKEVYLNQAAKEALEDASVHANDQFILDKKDLLSDREKEVLIHLCNERTTQETADIMNVSKRTVDGHRSNLLQKTSSKNTTGLVLYAIKANFINASELKINLY